MFDTNTPFEEGTKRALINGAGTFAFVAFSTYQGFLLCNPIAEACLNVTEPERLRYSLVAGVVAALAPFGIQTAQAGLDQRRANQGIVIASDVPVAIAAKESRRKPETVARDMSHPKP